MTTIDAVQAKPEPVTGKCVTLRGILANSRLYVDRQATIEIDDRVDDRRPRRSIVVMTRNRTEPAALVEVTGRIVDCGLQNDIIAAEQAKTNDVIMLGGYCHTSLETYLDRPSIRVLSDAPVARLVEAEVPASRRLLVPAPDAMPGLDRATAAARALLVAIATRDEVAFRRLHNVLAQDIIDTNDPAVPAKGNDWVEEAHDDFVKSATLGPIANKILSNPSGQTRSFIEASDFANLGKDGSSPYRITICWCTADDCTNRWPIAPFQADNAPGRPYFCAMVGDYLLGPGKASAPEVEIPQSFGGFAEP